LFEPATTAILGIDELNENDKLGVACVRKTVNVTICPSRLS